jgi:mono/diheme cytochrome c family protein
MAEVVSNLSSVQESDVHAIAVYMTSVFGPPSQDRLRKADEVRAKINSPPSQPAPSNAAGASIYTAACATCHESARPLPYGGVNLALSTTLSAPDPRNAANIIISGIQPVEGERSPIMPGFGSSMTDAQVAALLNYLRGRFSNQPGWSDVEKTVRDARRMQTVFLKTQPGPHNAPGNPIQRDKSSDSEVRKL